MRLRIPHLHVLATDAALSDGNLVKRLNKFLRNNHLTSRVLMQMRDDLMVQGPEEEVKETTFLLRAAVEMVVAS